MKCYGKQESTHHAARPGLVVCYSNARRTLGCARPLALDIFIYLFLNSRDYVSGSKSDCLRFFNML